MASTTLRFPTPRHLNQLYAGREENLILVERALGVQLVAREDWLKIDGTDADIARTELLFGFPQ
jgi:phosphate starvation-inducible PhoH-like protein